MATLHIPSLLRQYAGGKSVLPIRAKNVGGAVEELRGAYPGLVARLVDEQGAMREHLSVFVNDVNVRELGGIGALVAESDEVFVLPAVSGGKA